MSAPGPEKSSESFAQKIINKSHNELPSCGVIYDRSFALLAQQYHDIKEDFEKDGDESKYRKALSILKTAFKPGESPNIGLKNATPEALQGYFELSSSLLKRMQISFNEAVSSKAKLDIVIMGLKKLNISHLNIWYGGHSVEEAQQILLSLEEIPLLARLEFLTDLNDKDVEKLQSSAQTLPHLQISIVGTEMRDESCESQLSSKIDALHLQLGIYAASRNAAEQAFLLNEFTREYPVDCVVQAQETIRDGMAEVAVGPILNEITEFPDVITDMVQQYLGKAQTPFQVWQRERTTPLEAMSSRSVASSSASSSSSYSSSCSSSSSSSSASFSSSCAVAMPAPTRTLTVMWPQVIEFLPAPVKVAPPASASSSAAATVEALEDTDVEMEVAPSRGKNKRKLELGDDAEGRDAAEKTKQQKP